jgi:ABC-type multidrug transport system fused ATPase/permease subunit
MTPVDWYRERIREWTTKHDAASTRAVLLSRLRLAAFLGGVALLWWGLAHRQAIVAGAGVAAFVAFGALVVVHARVLNDVDRAEAARDLATNGIARIARDWNVLPEIVPPANLDLDTHPYARDLDLFGHASLAKWLGRTATADGTARLWHWLLAGSEASDTHARQAAVDELASKRDWRESLAIEGRLTAVSRLDLDRFLAWAEASDRAIPGVVQPIAIAITLATWALFAMFWTGATDSALWLIPLVIGIVLSFVFASRMYAVFDRAQIGERALLRYASMLSMVCDEQWTSPELLRLQALLRVGGDAPVILSKLARLAGWSELRIGAALLHFPIQAFTLWDFHVFFALDRWRARSGGHVRAWIDALGSVDALAVLAMVRADQPAWTSPYVDAAEDALRAIALGHPLIADDRRVVNDVRVGPPGTILLITGSNMSGKSTLLRAIGLNAVLAQAGAPVCATAFSMPPADLQTSIRVQDSLELGLSYFMAALARLKQIVDAAERGAAPGRALLYLLDEVLQGTNSVERAIAVRAVVQHLLDARAIGAMTTHDLALADDEPLKSAAELAHFTEQVHPDGTMTFDYRLRPGIATSTNALRLMQLIGITPK